MAYKLVKSADFPKMEMLKLIFIGSLFFVLFFLLYGFKNIKPVKYLDHKQKIQNL